MSKSRRKNYFPPRNGKRRKYFFSIVNMDTPWTGPKRARMPIQFLAREEISSMSPRVPTATTASVFLVLALGFGLYGVQSAHRAEKSLAALGQQLERREADAQRMRARIAPCQR